MLNNKRLLLFVLLIFMYSSAISQHEVTYSPVILSLDGSWKFKTDPNQDGERQKWIEKEVNNCSWDSMPVPGNWNLRNEYAAYAGKAWYRKSFTIPGSWKGKAFRLVFESISHDAKIWLNGKFLGKTQYGFLPFHIAIAPYINFESKNVIVVEVDNTFKLGALWNWGGIRRSVWVEVTDMQRLDYQHITAIPDLKNGSAKINVKSILENLSPDPVRVDLEYSIFYGGKRILNSRNKNILLPAHNKKEKQEKFDIAGKDVHLWDFDHPHLYHSIISVYRNGKLIHSINDQFGIRKVEVDGYTLKLNGQEIRPVGFNLVPDDRTTGNTLPLWRIKKDVDMMKSLGANMARISHLPLPKEFLDYLDQKGMLIFSEVSLWGKNRMVNPDSAYPQRWLENLIRTQYNHPCIIGWSVGNEIGYKRVNPEAMAYVESAIDHARRLDTTRLAVYVSNSAMNQKIDPVQYESFILLNAYGNWGDNAAKANKLHPDKPVFYSEYGKGIINEDPDKGIIDAAEMLNSMRGRKYLIGGALWTFNDYRSNYTGTGPSQNRAWGVVNVFRQPKRAFYSFKKEYAPVKKLKVDLNTSKENPYFNVTVIPRSKLDIPAYTLKGYQVIWTLLDNRNKVIQGGYYELPEIDPGDSPLNKQIGLKKLSGRSAALKVCLLSPSPGLYATYDTTIYLSSPATPEIKAVYSSSDRVRIEYSKVPFAKQYKVIYGAGVQKDTSNGSIDHFIEIKDLDWDKEYHFRLIALNDYGESRPSSVVKSKKTDDELPPVIWKTVPADHGFFVGYSVSPDDFLYDIKYGTSPGNYSHRLVLKNKGVLHVSGLKNGQTYYFRLRSRKQWGFKSEWSPEASVIPNGGLRPPAPKIHGVIKNGRKAIIYFDPIPKSTGYEILLQKKNGKMDSTFINGSDINYAEISDVEPNDIIYMKTKDQYGESDKVKVVNIRGYEKKENKKQ